VTDDLTTTQESGLAQLRPARPIRVWGIDLGTTNSTISEIAWSGVGSDAEAVRCRCLEIEQPTRDGTFTGPLVPSVVAVRRSGETWVGEGAKRLRTRPQEEGLVVEQTLFFDTKNEMGLRKTYYRATDELNCPWKIAARALSFLSGQAERISGAQPDRVVVTVPASFQLNQRRDTLLAAEQAGLDLKDYDLLDEPTAALLGYLADSGEGLVGEVGAHRVLVFDFGGGTCDISIVELTPDRSALRMKAVLLGASRYHRLGGGDLDSAIVHEVLIPALLEENGVAASDLQWSERKRVLEPQLLGTAEALKIALCREIDRLGKFGRYESSDRDAIVARQPDVVCTLPKNRQFRLTRPQLSARQWEDLIRPFLDTDHLYARESEYRLTQSVFAPLQDALERARLKVDQVDLVLLVGGSTLIPQVQKEVRRFFGSAEVVTLRDPLDVQLAISRGAAWHAFFLEATGRPFIQPVLMDTYALLIGDGEPYPLVEAGTPIPHPADGSAVTKDCFVIPRGFAGELALEVVARSTRQTIFSEKWRMDEEIDPGEPVTVEMMVGANWELDFRAYLTNRPEATFAITVENPLVNTVNPNQTRLRIEELEDDLRRRGGPVAAHVSELSQLARWYEEINHVDRAIEYLTVALRRAKQPDAYLLNLRAIYYGRKGDRERERKDYEAAAEADPKWGIPLFNLALALRNTRSPKEALPVVERALDRDPDSAPYMALRGLCLQDMGLTTEAQQELGRAVQHAGSTQDMSDWELGWFQTSARQLGRSDLVGQAEAERSRRQGGPAQAAGPDVLRPALRDAPEER